MPSFKEIGTEPYLYMSVKKLGKWSYISNVRCRFYLGQTLSSSSKFLVLE